MPIGPNDGICENAWMARTTPEQRRWLFIGGLVLVCLGVWVFAPSNRPAGPLFYLVAGIVLAGFSFIMLLNPADIRTRWQQLGLPQSWAKSGRFRPHGRWYFIAIFALGCFMAVSGLGGIIH